MTKVTSFLAALLCVSSLFQSPTFAQNDAPKNDTSEIESKLVLLSTTLGKTHAVQVLCNGRSDQFWRDQMSALLELEAPRDGPLRRKLIESFNAAYSEQDEALGQCDANARKTFDTLAQQGRSLAETINTLISNRE